MADARQTSIRLNNKSDGRRWRGTRGGGEEREEGKAGERDFFFVQIETNLRNMYMHIYKTVYLRKIAKTKGKIERG